jgi:primosomal protein N' (replication factor Y)
MKVLRVALEVPVAKLFDYLCDDAAPAMPGDRVVVPFGARDRVGVVVDVGEGSAVASARLKPVKRVLDDAPRLSPEWLEQMRFLASYYQRPLGETVAGALPPRLRSLKPLPKKRKAAQDAADASSRAPSQTRHKRRRSSASRPRSDPFAPSCCMASPGAARPRCTCG